jgi:hypothetical protein
MERKFDIGEKVETKSGLIATVLGSALYPYFRKGKQVCYRILVDGRKRAMYRYEENLSKIDLVEKVVSQAIGKTPI